MWAQPHGFAAPNPLWQRAVAPSSSSTLDSGCAPSCVGPGPGALVFPESPKAWKETQLPDGFTNGKSGTKRSGDSLGMEELKSHWGRLP